MSNIDSWDYCKTCGTEQMVNTAEATIECGSRDHRFHWVLRYQCSTASHVRVKPIGRVCDDCDLSFALDRMELVR